ncbi:MAG: HAMP domain-containing sensor histidine kinase [Pseudomonadota bacterium]
MLGHARNIFWLSVIISIIAAALVFVALSRLLVRPMLRIATNMVDFANAPEERARIIVPSGRTDEVGVAERELAAMQAQLADAFAERRRLAELGLAVSKINHDLRNMLSSAQMMSDRLSMVQDETTQRFAPKLIASLDRAIDFCNATLRFGKAAEAAPERSVFPLAPLLQDVADGLDLPRDEIAWHTDGADACVIDADRDHLYRVLNNICRNAVDTLLAAKVADARIHVSVTRGVWPTRPPPPAGSATPANGHDRGVENGAASSGAPTEAPAAPSQSRSSGMADASRPRRRRNGQAAPMATAPGTRIIIADNGPGVPERARQNLFRAFQGGARPGGTGLGLAISHELIAAHGGWLALRDDAPDAAADNGAADTTGAIFEIVIPDRALPTP